MRPSSTLLSATIVCIAVIGCSKSTPPMSPEEAHLKELATLYGRYQTKHGSLPPDEKSLRVFIQQLKQKGKTQVNNIDQVFLSPRDKQPYVVRYFSKTKATPNVVAYEKTGIGGKRYVAFVNTEIKEMTDAELKSELAK